MNGKRRYIYIAAGVQISLVHVVLSVLIFIVIFFGIGFLLNMLLQNDMAYGNYLSDYRNTNH